MKELFQNMWSMVKDYFSDVNADYRDGELIKLEGEMYWVKRMRDGYETRLHIYASELDYYTSKGWVVYENTYNN